MPGKDAHPDLYAILHVHPSADAQVIGLVYRHLVKQFHPDVASPQLRREHEEQLKRLNHAYGVLGSPEKRRLYDANRPDSSAPSARYAQAFETASSLAEAGLAGGGKEECFRRSCRVLRGIAAAAVGTPAAYEARLRLAELEYHQLKRYGKAADTLLTLARETEPSEDLDRLLLLLADCYVKLSLWGEAIKSFREIERIGMLPQSLLEARVGIADALTSKEAYAEAIKAYKLVADTYPGTTQAAYCQYQAARVLDSCLALYRSAIRAYRGVLRDYPQSSWAQDCQWRIDHIQRKHIDKKAWWE